LKDGLYWVPLIVHYTGARLEEIAGLPSAAMMPNGAHWGFDIRPHEERRLKNLQSERLLPVHEHLIDLGLVDHRNRMLAQKREFLFPELRPTSPKLPFHKAMKYNWDKARKMQLGSKAQGLTMHSLRHYVNITLKNNKAVEKSVRLDILGHAAEDLNEEVYTDGTSFLEKAEAINSIPRAF
jgi:integrase